MDTRLFKNPHERVCTLGALMVQYSVLQDRQRVADLASQLTQNDKDRLLPAIFDVAKSLSNSLILDRMALEGDVRQVEHENNRLVSKVDELTDRIKGAGLPLHADLETEPGE